MNDRELLELAAKAAGVESGGGYFWTADGQAWHPLIDDGDAFRLAVKLNLCIMHTEYGVGVSEPMGQTYLELAADDPITATRRAIVRAAAEIGKGMK